MSDGITVTGNNLFDIRMKLGIRYPDVGVEILRNNGIRFRLQYRGDSQTYKTVRDLCIGLHSLLRVEERELIKKVQADARVLKKLAKRNRKKRKAK
jgi:hypothetical protein